MKPTGPDADGDLIPTYDLLIIGAGQSGISALRVARKYLNSPSARIGLLDERRAIGGQWTDAYDYVRLHHPYPYYTAYDAQWKPLPGRPRHYLASRDEVLEYFSHVVREARADLLLGHRYISHVEAEEDSSLLKLTLEKKEEPGGVVHVMTKRLIIAKPIPQIKPFALPVSSLSVESISTVQLPEDLQKNGHGQTTRYVVIGSGKSAMDTIKYIHDSNKDGSISKVTLIAGNGVAFLRREKMFPSSPITCLFGGKTFISLMLDAASKWDGTNHEQLMQDFIDDGVLDSAVPNPVSSAFAMIGQDELRDIRSTIDICVKGRMSDVVDVDGVPHAIMKKSNEKVCLSQEEEERIVIVNCTQMYSAIGAPKPLVCDGGKTLIAQMFFSLPAASTSFLTHAWFLNSVDQLQQKLVPLQIGTDEDSKRVMFFKISLIGIHNFGILATVLPKHVMDNDRTNSLDWYPGYRQLFILRQLQVAYPDLVKKCERLVGDLRYPDNE